MSFEFIRKHRAPGGVALLLLVFWLAAGIRRTEGEGAGAVLDSPLGLLAPRVLAPGWHLVPPGLGRITNYPVESTTFQFEAGGDASPLVSREGIDLIAQGTIRYRVDPDRVLDVHRRLGPLFERESLGRWVAAELRAQVARSSYGDISGARLEDLRSQVGQALAERFRQGGLVLLSCDVSAVRIRAAPAPAASAQRRVRGMNVLLVGLDGGDWNIVDPLLRAGRLPNLARLIRAGTRARLRTIAPMLSPVVWTSIATGVLPERHGIVDFLASTKHGEEKIPVTSTLRKVKALWNILSENGVSVGITGWWATYPVETVDGFIVSDRVAYQLFGSRAAHDQPREMMVYPPELEPLVRPLTIAPETLGVKDVARYVRLAPDPSVLPASQAKLVEDLKTVIAAGDTYFQASLALGQKLHPEFQAFYLEGTDTIAHLFMPYAPPPMPGIEPELIQRFGHAVEQYYEHADEMIGRLLDTLKPKAVIVCSDHGFRTAENRPLTDPRIGYGQAADWHRKFGMLVLSGEPFRKGMTLEEASILDITPTVLAVFGLPVGEDMDGRPVSDAFDPAFLRDHPIAYTPTYESAGGSAGLRAARPERQGGSEAPRDPAGDQEKVEKLRSLGYLSQDTANSHNNRGLLLLNQGKEDDAVKEFERAISTDEDLDAARLNLARAYYKMKDYARATSTLQVHLQRQPQSKDAENLLGNIALEQNRLEDAEAHFRRALEYEPTFADARNSLGILYDRQGREQDALTQFERVVEMDKDYGEAYNNIGIIYKKQGRLDDAIAIFKRAIAADPGFSGSYSNLALAYEAKGNLKGAEEQFRLALRRDSENVAVRTNYGGLLYLQGRFEEAREELERAVRIDPDYVSVYNNLGAVYGRLGRSNDEIAAYRKAEALDPDYVDVHYNLGLALVKAGRLEEGEGELQRSLALDHAYVPAYVTLGQHFLQQGQSQQAVDLLLRGSREAPRDASIPALLGEGFLALGQREKAIAAFESSLALAPDQDDLRRKLESLRGAQAPGGVPPQVDRSGGTK